MRFLKAIAILGLLAAAPAAAQQGQPAAKSDAKPLDVEETKPLAEQPRKPVPPIDDKNNLWLLDLSDGGRVTIWLRPDVAPNMVERVRTLTRQGFYNGLLFHRVIDGFMAQGGDPKGDGTGGSQLPDLKSEFNYLPHVRGAVAAARADDPNSANSQFFIVFQPRLSLDKKYTVFGRVLDGMQYVDAIERGEPPANPTRILRAYIAADNPPAYQPGPPPAPRAATLDGPSLESAPAKPAAKPKLAPAAESPPRRQ